MNSEKDLEVHEKPEIVIQDACILFDLVDLALLEAFFQLDLIVFTTPQVIDEITNEEQFLAIKPHIVIGRLNIDHLGTFEAITEIFNEFPGLSFADSSVLELSLRKNASILSSDGSLRKIATRKNQTVRGTLWIVETLYLLGIISREQAIHNLETYSTINQRAPTKEIGILIKKLENS